MKKLIAILFLIGCLVGFAFHAIWTIRASHAWIGFFSMVWNVVGIYLSWNVIRNK